MNKRGFTLVELLAVIMILGILSLVAVPTVVKTVKKSREQAYNTMISNIKVAMQNWKVDNKSLLPKAGEKIYLTISQLKHEGYLENELYNPSTEKPFPNDTLLAIVNEDGVYQYEVYNNTGTSTEKYDSATPYLELPSLKTVLKVGDEYTESTVKAYDSNGNLVTASVKTSLLGTSFSTSTPGTYYVLYQATIDNIPVAIVNTIVVENDGLLCTAVSQTTSGVHTIGDIYSCNFNGAEYTFYVLAINANSVSLIMDKNMGNNVSYASALTYLASLKNIFKGASVSMPDANQIAVASGMSNWTKNDESPNVPGWLHANLNCTISTCSQGGDSSSSTIGYWTTTAYDTNTMFEVDATGKIVHNRSASDSDYYGVRPVIEIDKTKIEN